MEALPRLFDVRPGIHNRNILVVRHTFAACAAFTFAYSAAVAHSTESASPAPVTAAESTRHSDATALEQAQAIVRIMFPPETREQTFAKTIDDMLGQFRRAMKVDSVPDAGLRKMLNDQFDAMPGLLMPTVREYLPQILDATALAYTHEYSLDELRHIRAFAETPAGSRYLQTSMKLLGDPAVAKVNEAYLEAIQKVQLAERERMQAEIVDYLKKHPDVAAKLQGNRVPSSNE
ncbi:MAG: hypothetical protein ACR2PC_00810 [Tsuneonella suprasediminis]|nr:hypothetical protein LBX01_12350 [Altererythrobacter sp. N1]